jgi:hypothetical protein
MTDKQIIEQLRTALRESQTALAETQAAHQAVLQQVAPLRLLARAVAWVDDVESQFDIDVQEQCRARATLQQALTFYRDSVDPRRLAAVREHFDQIALLRAAEVLSKAGTPRMQHAGLFLRERARRGSSRVVG